MTQGKARLVENENARFGADPSYWFVKIQHADQGEQGEEYWLLTDAERLRFERRAATATGHAQGDAPRPILHPGRVWLPEPPGGHRGVLHRVRNDVTTFGTLSSYLAVFVFVKGATDRWWVLTDRDVERIRYRVFTNHEDIDREREGWLADLLD